jgi:hypothetical protein
MRSGQSLGSRQPAHGQSHLLVSNHHNLRPAQAQHALAAHPDYNEGCKPWCATGVDNVACAMQREEEVGRVTRKW